MQKLVIIGAGPAGVSAALAASKQASLPLEVDITLLTDEAQIGYCRCALPLLFSKKIDMKQTIPDVIGLLSRAGVNVLTRTRVTEIDLEDKYVVGGGKRFDYDKLIITVGTGVRKRINVKGADLPHVFQLQIYEDGINVQEALRHAESILVIGSDFVGTEVVCFAGKNYRTVWVDSESIIRMPGQLVDPDMAEMFSQGIEKMGVELCFDVQLDKMEILPGRVKVGETSYRADIVVDTIGGEKIDALELVCETELEFGVTGRIKVNARMETNVPDVYAAGTCTEYMDFLGGPTPSLGQTIAILEGKAAGISAMGGNFVVQPLVIPGVLASEYFQLGYAGLVSLESAKARGFSAISAHMTCATRARYYPDTQNIFVRLIADKATGRLLGGAFFAKEGVKERTNLLEFALKQGAGVADLQNYETAFLPNLGPAPEAIVMVADILARKLQS